MSGSSRLISMGNVIFGVANYTMFDTWLIFVISWNIGIQKENESSPLLSNAFASIECIKVLEMQPMKSAFVASFEIIRTCDK